MSGRAKACRSVSLLVVATLAVAMAAGTAMQSKQDSNDLKSLIKRLKQSDFDDFEKFKTFGDEAFDLLIAEVRRAKAEREKTFLREERTGLSSFEWPEEESDKADKIADWYSNSTEALLVVSNDTHTSQLLSLWLEFTDKSEPYYFSYPMGRILDHEQAAPVFTEFLKTADRRSKEDLRYFATNYLTEHPTREAAALLAGMLLDPNENRGIRILLLGRLALAGGDVGVRAVMKAMPRDKAAGTILQMTGIVGTSYAVYDEWSPSVLALSAGPKGTKWALFTSSLLGNPDDLWIGQFKGGKWVSVAFTGVMVDEPYEWDDVLSPEHKRWNRLVVKNQGITELIEDESIWLDSDSDGLTDKAEERLGTDPHNRDSDQDGKSDLHDPSPLTRPRPLSQEEQAIKAGVHAFFGVEGSSRFHYVKYPEGTEPFEMGLGAPVIPVEHRQYRELMADGNRMVGSLTVSIKDNHLDGSHSSGFQMVIEVSVSGHYGMNHARGATYHMALVGSDWILVAVTDARVS